MFKKIPQFLEYFLDDCLYGDVQYTTRSMFGGYGVYKNGKIFSIFCDGELYFKVGDNNLLDYKRYNSNVFKYTKKGKAITMGYYVLPEEILENREELDTWIKKSLEVSIKIEQKNKSKKIFCLNEKILKELLMIPKGKVTTYKNLADKFGVHPRRIASIMKTNKNPDLYPCYKVISHSGKLSGYSGPDGINSKISMLEADGIKVIEGKIPSNFII